MSLSDTLATNVAQALKSVLLAIKGKDERAVDTALALFESNLTALADMAKKAEVAE